MTIVCMGELLIDFVALESGVSVGEASGFVKAPGGAPANVAVAVARLGGESAFIGQVGADPFGHHLRDVLAAEGVDVRGLRMTGAANTMLAFVSLRADGERSFSFYRNPSADMLMRPEDVDLEIIGGAKIFHFGSITLINEPSRSATLAAVRAAQAAGALISYDPNLRPALWESTEAAKVGIMSGMEFADVLKVSDEELLFLTGGDTVEPLWAAGERLKLIVVTRGGAGASLFTREKRYDSTGKRVNAIDTTGAGDAFVAGLLVKLNEHPADYIAQIEDILRFANACGALTTTQRGAIPSLPTRQQAESFAASP